MFEGMIKSIFKEVKGIDYTEKVERMTWDEAMRLYGNDKPDIRFEMQLKDLTPLVGAEGSQQHEFKVFKDAELVVAIVVKGAADYTRKQLDELTDWVKRPQVGMTGLIYFRHNADGSIKSSVDKFFDEAKLARMGCRNRKCITGDLVLVLAGREERTRKAMSDLRLMLGERLGLRKPEEFKLLWVMDFPLFEYDEEGNRWVARHHPFTSPKPEHIEVMINNDHGH